MGETVNQTYGGTYNTILYNCTVADNSMYQTRGAVVNSSIIIGYRDGTFNACFYGELFEDSCKWKLPSTA